MPYQDNPENQPDWQSIYLYRARGLQSRAVRQFLIVDLPFFATVACLIAAGLLLASHLGRLVGFGSAAPFLSRLTAWVHVTLPPMVMLVCVYVLLRTAKTFVISLFRPSSEDEIWSRIWHRLWGGHEMLFPQYLLVKDAKLDPPDHWSKWLGGPVYLIIYDGFALYLERGNCFSRVVGAGVPIPYLDTRETIKAVVDLRPQIREVKVNAWTKDGIRVVMKVRVEFQIRLGSPQKPSKATLMYPFDPRYVQKAVEYTAIRIRESEPVESDWCEGVMGSVSGFLAHHISSRRMDELFLTDRGNGQMLSAEVMGRLLEDVNNGLEKAGAYISSIQITEIHFPEDVYGQRLDVWKAGKDSLVTRIHGEAHAYEIRVGEEARARAQRDLIVSITRSLETMDPQQFPEATLLSLSKVLDQGLKDPIVRALMSRETLLLLDNLGALLI